jgi:3-hydroxymyristoyl/3-hydroxydecanoyl-(acyl carrier protein) dehydratase
MIKNLNKKQISSLTQIKNPFLMVDEIRKLINLKSGIGIKKIKKNSWFFTCHFINNPVMPGTLIQEAMLQTIVSIIYSNKKFRNKICLNTSSKTSYFSKIDKPTTLYIYANILKVTLTKIEATATVKNINNKKVASGNFNYFISIK